MIFSRRRVRRLWKRIRKARKERIEARQASRRRSAEECEKLKRNPNSENRIKNSLKSIAKRNTMEKEEERELTVGLFERAVVICLSRSANSKCAGCEAEVSWANCGSQVSSMCLASRQIITPLSSLLMKLSALRSSRSSVVEEEQREREREKKRMN